MASGECEVIIDALGLTRENGRSILSIEVIAVMVNLQKGIVLGLVSTDAEDYSILRSTKCQGTTYSRAFSSGLYNM